MAITLEGDGTISGVTTFTTPLDDISFDSINVTGIVTASTFQAGTGVSISSPRSQTLALFTNNVEGLHLDDAGRVGIGTTNANKAADANNAKVVNAGIITANQYYGNQLTAVGANITGVTTFTGNSTFGGDVTVPDKIIHTGDTDTAIRFPGTDIFTIETGGSERVRVDSAGLKIPDKLLHAGDVDTFLEFGTDTITLDTAGSERVRITSAGLVGIGSDSPASTLDVGGDIKILDNSPRLTFHDENAVGAANATGGFEVYDNAGNRSIYVGSINASNTINFATTDTERLRINADGLVLVGVTASRAVGTATAHKFQVEAVDATAGVTVTRCNAGSVGPYLSFGKSRAGSLGDNTVVQSGDSLGMIRFAGADGTDTQNVGAQIQAFVDGTPGTDDMPGRLSFFTTADGANTSTERLRITSTGRLQTMGNSENISMDSSANGQFMVDGNGYGFAVAMDASACHLYHNSSSRDLILGTNEIERLRINGSSGVVGINTDAGNAQLVVHKNSTNTTITGHNYLATQSGMMIQNRQQSAVGQFTAFTGNVSSAGGYTQSASMVIESTATAYSPKMHFTRRSGSGTQGINMTIDAAGEVGIGLTEPATRFHVYHATDNSVARFESGDAYCNIVINDSNSNASRPYFGVQADDFRFVSHDGSNSGEKLRILNTGGITFNGDTATANALDDYEEGTWTPTLHDASGNSSSFGSVTEANYTKIGNSVRLTLRAVNMDSTGMTTGNTVYLKGLPFTTQGYNYAWCFLRTPDLGDWGPSTNTIFSYCNTNQITFQGSNGSSGVTLTWADISDGVTDLFLTTIYKTGE